MFLVSLEALQFLCITGSLRVLNSLALALQSRVTGLEWTSQCDLHLGKKFSDFSAYFLNLCFITCHKQLEAML